LAKYATKAAESTGTLDRRITAAGRLTDLPAREHARRHIAECLRLGKLPQLSDLRLAAWAHMLSFRGHFSTKSRAFSITLGSLRADRAVHQREYAIAAGLQPDADGDTTLVLTDWHYAGRGDPPIDLLPSMGGAPWPRLLMTVPEAAEALAISRSKLYELLASGAIASVRIDGSRRIPLTSLEEYVLRLLTGRTAA
jgi:excisionase family DNA binding protein